MREVYLMLCFEYLDIRIDFYLIYIILVGFLVYIFEYKIVVVF